MAITAAKKGLEKKSLNSPDETRSFEKGKLELATVGGITFGRATFQPGWKWSTCVKPLAKTETCQAPHALYQISGRMKVVMEDGTEIETKAGDVAIIPPGHDAWVVGNEPVAAIDVTGLKDYAKPRG